MYYRTTPLAALRDDLTAAGFAVEVAKLPGLANFALLLGRRP
jgi:hypothetical protein